MKRILILSLACLSLSSPALAMGGKPTVSAGGDVISSAELANVTRQFQCEDAYYAKLGYQGQTARKVNQVNYDAAVQAQAKGNRATFDKYAAIIAKTGADTGCR